MEIPNITNIQRRESTSLGVVYTGRDTLLDSPVNVVRIHPRIMESESFQESLLKWARLNHPHIVKLRDVLVLDGKICLVVDPHPLKTLEHYAMEIGGRLDPEQAISIIEQVCSALAYAHDLGAYHKSPSTDNIYFESGAATLFGFGVAYLSWRGSQTTELAPHYRFFSPEQTRGEIATAATEVYSLASILYRLLTGRPPFESENLTFLIEQTLHVKPHPPTTLVPSLPGELSDVILKGLAKRPEERYGSIAEFVVALESSY